MSTCNISSYHIFMVHQGHLGLAISGCAAGIIIRTQLILSVLIIIGLERCGFANTLSKQMRPFALKSNMIALIFPFHACRVHKWAVRSGRPWFEARVASSGESEGHHILQHCSGYISSIFLTPCTLLKFNFFFLVSWWLLLHLVWSVVIQWSGLGLWI